VRVAEPALLPAARRSTNSFGLEKQADL